MALVLVLMALPQASAFQLPVPKDYTVLTQNSGEVSREEKKAFKFILKDVRIDPDYSGAMLDKWDCNCKPGIKKASVSVMWNVLMGEAIEDYKFYWEGTGHYQGEGAFGVSNLYVLLEKYPDLLKRYINDVIPRFKLRFSVKLQDPEYGMQNPGFTKVVSSDLFMVGKSGKLADVSVSSSPGWEKFFTRPDGVRLLDGELERDVKKLKPQFMKSRKITVYAEIFDLEWPRAIIEAIVEEYERREGLLKEEETEKDSRDTEEDGFWTGEEEKSAEEDKTKQEMEDDFWKGEEKNASTTIKDDKFWLGESPLDEGNNNSSEVKTATEGVNLLQIQNELRKRSVKVVESDFITNKRPGVEINIHYFEPLYDATADSEIIDQDYLWVKDYKECGFYYASSVRSDDPYVYYTNGEYDFGNVYKGDFISHSGKKIHSWNTEGEYSKVSTTSVNYSWVGIRYISRIDCVESPNRKQHNIVFAKEDGTLKTRPNMSVNEGYYIFDLLGNSTSNGYIKLIFLSENDTFQSEFIDYTSRDELRPSPSQKRDFEQLYALARLKEDYSEYGIFIGLRDYQINGNYEQYNVYCSWCGLHNLEFDIISAKDYSVIDSYTIKTLKYWFIENYDD